MFFFILRSKKDDFIKMKTLILAYVMTDPTIADNFIPAIYRLTAGIKKKEVNYRT